MVACKRCVVVPLVSHRFVVVVVSSRRSSRRRLRAIRSLGGVCGPKAVALRILYATGAHAPGLGSTRSMQPLTVGTDWSLQIRSNLLLSIDTRRRASGLAIATAQRTPPPLSRLGVCCQSISFRPLLLYFRPASRPSQRPGGGHAASARWSFFLHGGLTHPLDLSIHRMRGSIDL